MQCVPSWDALVREVMQMDKRSFTAVFTGHREIRPGDRAVLWTKLNGLLLQLVTERGYRYFGSGGARGFDLMAARAVLNLKCNYPHVRLIMVLPCLDQTKLWHESERKEYSEVLQQADGVKYTHNGSYYDGCMQKRNRRLVNHASLVIAYCYRLHSGTGQTISYADAQKVQVINLA